MATRAQQIRPEVFILQGGLDLTTPALSLPPGKLLSCTNFEPSISGGYRRVYGHERFDGNPSPSAQGYWILGATLTGAVSAGDTLTGATSGATCVVLQVGGSAISFVNSSEEAIEWYNQSGGLVEFTNNESLIIVTALTGTFVSEETLNDSGSVGTLVALPLPDSAVTPLLHSTYLNLAAGNYRTLIGAVPGSGPVLGNWYYNGALYAFRNNAGGTAAVMYKSTSSGWVAVTLGKQMRFKNRVGTATITLATPGVVTFAAHGAPNGSIVSFSTTGALPTGITANSPYYVVSTATNTFEISATLGGAAIATSGSQSGVHTATFQCFGQVAVGDTITGAASGATAVVAAAPLQTGTWNVAPVGSFVFAAVTGSFVSGEALIDTTQSSQLIGQATTAAAQITLTSGGRYEFVTFNFSGSAQTVKMYGCDGKNYGFEFDGTTYVPIITGLQTDTPNFVTAWQSMLIFAYGTNVEVSGINQPYSWTALTGAAVIALGDQCSGLLPQLGDQTGGAMAIFTSGLAGRPGKTFMLYGTSISDFNLVLQAPDAGAKPYTAQNIGFAYYLDTVGVVQVNSTRNYGNFEIATLTRTIQPLINSKLGLVTASCVVRGTNQYRLFFSDGTGITMFMQSSISQYTNTPITSVGGITFFDFQSATGMYFNTVSSAIDATGTERIFGSGSDGFVYELERGTSWDGANIQANLITAFNSSKCPRNRKHYHRTVLQATCLGTAEVSVGYSLGYGGPDSADGVQTSESLSGAGGWWDQFTWNQFNWDAPYLTDYNVDTPGDGTNIAMVVYGNSAIDLPYTINSGILHYTINRLER